MSSESDLKTDDTSSFLAQDEEMELQWQGVLLEGEDEEHPAEFVATDNRLVFSFGRGHFKDIGFNHIESVETGTDIETKADGTDPDALIMIGVIAGIAGLGAMIMGGFSGFSMLAGSVLLLFGGYAIWWGKDNYDQLKEDREVTEYEVYHILLRTSATSQFHMPIYIKTTENVGPTLSRLVTEANS